MKALLEDLKKEYDDNRMEVIMSVATAVTAVVGIGNMLVNRRNSRTWKKEVNRRVKNSK